MVWRRVFWRMGSASLALLTLSVVIASGAAGQSGDPWIITSDTTLESDYTGTVLIESDNVVLDCAGHTLHSSGDSPGSVGVVIDGRSDVSVVDCVLDDYGIGIDIADSVLITIRNTALQRLRGGDAFVGIRVRRSSQVSIVGNTVMNFRSLPGPCHGNYGCPLAFGIQVSDSADVGVHNNSASNGGHGFRIFRSVRVTLEVNDATGNWGTGFYDSAPSGNTYSGNVCHDNHGRGSWPAGLCDWGVTDRVGFFDPLSGQWHVPAHDGTPSAFYFGERGDIPLVGAWGNLQCYSDPKPGVYRPSEAAVYLRGANDPDAASYHYRIGNPGDVPLAGDFDGHGCDTVSLYRPSTQQFFIFNQIGTHTDALTQPDTVFIFGNPGDIPVVGDWDGDGIDEIGLHRPTTGEFYWRNTLDTGIADGKIYYGDPGDRFLAGDWGIVDGRDTPGVFRPSDTTVYLRHTLTQGPADNHYPAGEPDWVPITVTSAIADNATTS